MGTGSGVVRPNFGKAMSSGEATEAIRERARGRFDYLWTDKVKQQMAERELYDGDILHVLKYGVVSEEGEMSTVSGLFKYKMDAPTPNSNNRLVRVVVVVGRPSILKVCEVTWADEPLGIL